MPRIKNKSSGIIHASKKGYAHLGLCGADIYSFITLNDCHKITCKRCIRILKDKEKKKRTCKYPDCIYYSPNATRWCCNACCGDHWKQNMLEKEEREMEKLRAEIVEDLKTRIKSHHINFSIKLEKKALKALVFFVEKHADIYETTSLSTIITQAIEGHCAYLKEDQF